MPGRAGVLVLVAIAENVLIAAPAPRTPILATPHFLFRSDLDTNLNDALIAAGLAHKDGQPELFHSGEESACFDKRPASERAAWDAAVTYFATIVSPADWTDRRQYSIRMQLAGFDDELRDEEDRRFVEIVGHLRAAASAAYIACRWPAQDARNRKWIAELQPQLAQREKTVAERVQQLYAAKWPTLPIPVDVVEVVNWAGANSSIDPSHLLVSSGNDSASALEVVFHEASHILMSRSAPVRKALDDAAAAAGFKAPGDLWHVVLFYTTGEAVRSSPEYKPMLHQLFERGSWSEYRGALETTWRPYVDGKKTLAEAAADFISAVKEPSPKR